MREKVFLICKWVAIACFFPAVILVSLNLVNELWLHNNWGENIVTLGTYFLRIFNLTFFLAILLVITEKEEAPADKE